MKKSIFTLLLLTTVMFSSCDKIIENKIDGTWKMGTATRDGGDYSVYFQLAGYSLVLDKSGTFSESYTGVNTTGKWAVVLKGTAINLTQTDGTVRVYTIIKAKKDQLHVKTITTDGHSDEYTLLH